MNPHGVKDDPFCNLRHNMVSSQIRSRGISNQRLLKVMQSIPRHLFVPRHLQESAYDDHALPLDNGQTISQPYMVALMTEALCLQADDKVLEIGTGSGYQTAILASLTRSVFTIERLRSLSHMAEKNLRALGYDNIHFVIGDGTLGLPDKAPYNCIIATGSLPQLPENLLAQLDQNGILVAPVGGRSLQKLLCVKRIGTKVETHNLGGCQFVPLIGQNGWSS